MQTRLRGDRRPSPEIVYGALIDPEALIACNRAVSETVSAEDYCDYWVNSWASGVAASTTGRHTPLWPDTARMHQVLGSTIVLRRDGFRRMVEARNPAALARDPPALGSSS